MLRNNLIKNVFVLALLIFILLPFSSAEVRVDMPNILTDGVPYKATLVVNEPSLQKYTKEIRYICSNCHIILKEEDKSSGSNFGINLTGRDKIDFYVIPEYNRVDKSVTGTNSKIHFTFVGDVNEIHEAFSMEGYHTSKIAEFTKNFGVVTSKMEYSLPSLPSDAETEYEYDDFFGSYTFRDSQEIGSPLPREPMLLGSRFEVKAAPCFNEASGYNYNCYNNIITDEDIKNGETFDGVKLEKLELIGGSGYYYVSDSVGSIKEVTNEKGEHLYNIATVTVRMNFAVFNEDKNTEYHGRCTKSADVKEGDQDSFVSDALSECESVLGSVKKIPIGSAPSVPKDEFEYNLPGREKAKDTFEYEETCELDSDCDEEESCTACGECRNSKKVFDINEAEVEFKLSIKYSSKSIPNTIHNRILTTTKIDSKFTIDGKNVNYCDLSAPGFKDYELVAEMKNEDSYAGFINGWVLDERKKEERKIIDFSEDGREYSSLISPKDRKKMIGAFGDVSENIEFRIEKNKASVFTNEEKIALKAIEMDIQIKSSGQQLQQDSNKLIKYEVKDKYAKFIMIKGSLIGPGRIDNGKYKSQKFYDDIKPGVEKKVMYYSPKFGNFDIAKEMGSLSMTDLQVEAGKQIIQDATLAYAGEYAGKVGELYAGADDTGKAGMNALRGYFKRNPGKYNPEKAYQYIKKFGSELKDAKIKEMLSKSYDLYAKTYGLSNIPKGTVGMRDNMKDAASVDTVSNKKTTTENVAEYGVVGIDVLQTGVGILTFLPNKIPVLGKLSAGAQTAFSAMTNIWKANLKYVAKAEKIDRADEKFIPVMILITAEDESGWQQTKGYMLQVAYHEI